MCRIEINAITTITDAKKKRKSHTNSNTHTHSFGHFCALDFEGRRKMNETNYNSKATNYWKLFDYCDIGFTLSFHWLHINGFGQYFHGMHRFFQYIFGSCSFNIIDRWEKKRNEIFIRIRFCEHKDCNGISIPQEFLWVAGLI